MANTATVACPYHPHSHLIEDFHAGDMICSDCGVVVADRVIDVGSEWRTFSNDKESKDASRVGAAENELLTGGDLTTNISWGKVEPTFDENGRMNYRNRKQMNSTDRALLNAFREIAQMSDKLNLPSMITDRANVLFRQVTDTKALKGRSNDAIASACLYIACRQEAVPRTFKEICAVSKTSKKETGRVFKLILKALETNVDIITTGDFMSRFTANLSLSMSIQKCATHIAKKAVDLDLVPSRSPVSIAAAAIYMASQASADPKTQQEIGEVAGVAEVTIRQSYKLMYPKAAQLFPDDFTMAIPFEQLPRH